MCRRCQSSMQRTVPAGAHAPRRALHASSGHTRPHHTQLKQMHVAQSTVYQYARGTEGPFQPSTMDSGSRLEV